MANFALHISYRSCLLLLLLLYHHPPTPMTNISLRYHVYSFIKERLITFHVPFINENEFNLLAINICTFCTFFKNAQLNSIFWNFKNLRTIAVAMVERKRISRNIS